MCCVVPVISLRRLADGPINAFDPLWREKPLNDRIVADEAAAVVRTKAVRVNFWYF
jgi:hypothetical protein